MAKRLIALVISDIHYNIWKDKEYGEIRTKATEEFLTKVVSRAHKENVNILFCGDLLHNPNSVSNALLRRASLFFNGLFRKYPKVKILSISGNHDLDSVNTEIGMANSYIDSFAYMYPNIISIDGDMAELGFKVGVFGIPYLNFNKGMDVYLKNGLKKLETFEKKVLLIHTDLPNAADTDGRVVGSDENIPMNMGKFFKGWDLVLSGHIHKHQKLWKDRVIMVGASNHQRITDKGCSMGYLELYDDMSFNFVNSKLPEFKFYHEGTDEKTDDFHLWKPIPKPIKVIETKTDKKFKNIDDRESLAKGYIKYKGIKSKKKLQELINVLKKAND